MTAPTWTSKLPDIIARQLPITGAWVLNDIARQAAEDIRFDARKEMRITSPTLLKFFVRGPSPSATRSRHVARVVVGAPRTAKDPARGNLLTQHDEQGKQTKTPISGDHLMIPSRDVRAMRYQGPARAGGRGGVKGLTWRDYKRDLFGRTGKAGLGLGNILSIGRKFPTYLIKARKTGRLLLFIRNGRGKRNTDLLYFSNPRAQLPPRLEVRDTTRLRIGASAMTAFKAALGKAIATARPITRGGGSASTRLPNVP